MADKIKTWADHEVTIIECPDVLLHGKDSREFSVNLDGGRIKEEDRIPFVQQEAIESKGK